MTFNKEFFENVVGGTVKAQFVKKDNDELECRQGASLNHYGIEISLVTQNPDVQGVVYKLHPTYYDPVREETDRDNDFKTKITSYGDYDFNVEVQVGTRIVRDSFKLSELLKNSHENDSNPEIQKALTDIKNH